MPDRARLLSLIAAVTLGVAVGVIVVTPVILAAPTPLSTPSAAVVAIGCVGASAGGHRGRRIALAVAVAGLVLSSLWLLLASDGFGLGTPWWDDMVEAAILAGLFLVALILLLLARWSGPRRV
jgi:hypothetical protein